MMVLMSLSKSVVTDGVADQIRVIDTSAIPHHLGNRIDCSILHFHRSIDYLSSPWAVADMHIKEQCKYMDM